MIHLSIDGWMDDEWMHSWMHSWMDGCMNEYSGIKIIEMIPRLAWNNIYAEEDNF